MRKIILTDIQREIIIGSLLGDAYCQRGKWKNSNCRIQFSQNGKNKDYLYYLYGFFSDFSTAPHVLLPKAKANPRKGFENTSATYKFYTPMHPVFNEFRTMFYDANGLKFVPSNIGDLLTTRGLAIWLQDDGSFHKGSGGMELATHSFTREDAELLVKILQEKFNLVCTIYRIVNAKNGDIYHVISIKARCMDILREQVKPYFHSSMLYKLGIRE